MVIILQRYFKTLMRGIVFSIFFISAASAQPLFSVKQLPVPLGTSMSAGLAVTNSGRILGYIIDNNLEYRGVVWFAENATLLECSSPASTCIVRSINERGQIGMDVVQGGGASLFERGVITALLNRGEATNLYMINESGKAVGTTRLYTGRQYPTLWTKDDAILLSPLHGFEDGEAQAINNRGDAVGVSKTSASSRATQWKNGQATDLGLLNGYIGSQAISINNKGDIIGLGFSLDRRMGAALWRDGQIIDLGGLPGFTRSWPMAINNTGQIVGRNVVPCVDCFSGHAVLWHDDIIFDLYELTTWEGEEGKNILFSEATAINDSGHIIVNGVNVVTQQTRAYLLTPLHK